MPKCSVCNRSVKKLVSYGKMLLCKDCLRSYEEQSTGRLDTDKWLIRTTDGHILGPYDHSALRTLITDKKVVFLDEVSCDGDDWNLIKNISSFKDLALKTDYKLSESTVDIDVRDLDRTASGEERKDTSRPPIFKREKRVPIPVSLPDVVEITSSWKRPLIATAAVLVLVTVGTFIFIGVKGGSNKNHSAKYSNETSDYFNKYYIKGREYEEGGLFKEALDYYRKALAAVPGNSGVRIKKAAIDLMVLSNTNEAAKVLQELYAESNVGKVTDQEEQCDIKTFLGLLEAQKNNHQAAMGYFNQALAIRPTNAYIYYNIGRVLFKQQNYSGSIEYFRNSKKLAASLSDAALYEGLALLKLAKYREALQVFTEAQTQNPNMREFYTLGAYAAIKMSNVPKAYASIKKMLMIDPYYFKREFTPLYQMPKEELINEEISYVGEVIRGLDDGQKAEGYCVAALLSLVKGNADEGFKILASAGQAEFSEKLMVAGILYFHQQKYEDAKKKIDKSLEMDYSNNIAHLYAGQLSLKNNDLGQARNHFTKAQSSDESTSLYATTLLGDIYIKSGEQNAAIVLWKKVLSLDARYTPAWERVLSFSN